MTNSPAGPQLENCRATERC